MKKIKLFLFLLLTGFAALFTACHKDDDSGYVTVGSNNNTVMVSTVTVNPGDWTQNNGGAVWSCSVSNNNVNLYGGVEVFLQDNSSSDSWWALPFVNANFTYYFKVTPDASIITFYVAYVNNTTTFTITNSMTYKVVAIPPSARIAHPGVNWKNYNEIKKTFKIKEIK